MGEKEKVAEVVKETRTIKLQGRQVERLAALNKKLKVLNEQQAGVTIEQVKIKGGMEALFDLNAEPGEKAVTYDFNKCELFLEKEVRPEVPAVK